MLGLHAIAEAPIGQLPTSLAIVLAEETVFAATEGFATAPSDALSNTYFEGRLKSPPTLERSIVNGRDVGGAASIGFGDIELENSDGFYDSIVSSHAIDGRRVTIRLGDPDGGFSYSEFGTIFDGSADGWQLEPEDTVRVTLRDWSHQLELPIARSYYGGSGGNDGTADLAGKPVQQCWGVCENVTATLVDPLLSVWQVNDGPMQSIDVVYVRGIQMSPTDYTVDLDGGRITFLVGVDGQVTADVKGSKPGGVYVQTTADIVKLMLTVNAGWATARLDLASFDGVNAVQPAVIGYVASSDMTISSAIAEIVYGIGGFRSFTRDGRMQVGVFGEPEGEPVATFTKSEILEIRRVDPPSVFYPPSWRRRVGYRRNWTVQTTDVAAGVDASRVSFLREQYRFGLAQDNTVKESFILAQDVEPKVSFFADKTDADVEAVRLLTLTSTPRGFYEVRLKTQPFTLDPNNVVKIIYPRWELVEGRLARLVRVRDDARNDEVTITVFV